MWDGASLVKKPKKQYSGEYDDPVSHRGDIYWAAGLMSLEGRKIS